MLSKKLVKYFKSNGWWYENYTENYLNVIKELDIDLDTEFATFYLHVEDSVTFYSRNKEIYQICWFIINSNYELDLKRTHNILNLPQSFIPLDSFEGGGGFFYDRLTKQVIELELGEKLENFNKGIVETKWNDFNEFLEWYFELI
ncbi:hypothetical protein [Lacinutrix salivirga]